MNPASSNARCLKSPSGGAALVARRFIAGLGRRRGRTKNARPFHQSRLQAQPGGDRAPGAGLPRRRAPGGGLARRGGPPRGQLLHGDPHGGPELAQGRGRARRGGWPSAPCSPAATSRKTRKRRRGSPGWTWSSPTPRRTGSSPGSTRRSRRFSRKNRSPSCRSPTSPSPSATPAPSSKSRMAATCGAPSASSPRPGAGSGAGRRPRCRRGRSPRSAGLPGDRRHRRPDLRLALGRHGPLPARPGDLLRRRTSRVCASLRSRRGTWTSGSSICGQTRASAATSTSLSRAARPRRLRRMRRPYTARGVPRSCSTGSAPPFPAWPSPRT